MSTLSAPSRSTSASAPSTPSSRRPKSPIELTPRSKVRAMLAALDDDSEADVTSIPSRARPRPIVRNALEEQTSSSRPDKNTSDSGEDDDNVVSQIPKGRMAARMLGNVQGRTHTEDGDSSDGQGVYARIKRQLLRRKISQEEKEKSTGVAPAVGSCDHPEEEEHTASTPAARRKTTAEGDRAGRCSTTPQSRSSSLGLFVSPSRSSSKGHTKAAGHAFGSDSDSDLPVNPQANARFQELVARKRAERKAEQQAARKKTEEERVRAQQAFRSIDTAETDSEGEREARRRLTEQARPTRKAGKKALEEMNRETQRMSRNMQLAHQAKTKKKITTKDLFKRFNFRQGLDALGEQAQPGQDVTAPGNSSMVSSDVDASLEQDTPPTSPPSHDDILPKETVEVDETSCREDQAVLATTADAEYADEDLPTLQDVLSQPREDKGKGHASELPVPQRSAHDDEPDSGSEDDLEIIHTDKASRFPVFDRLPDKRSNESHFLLTLRALAHLTSPSKTRRKGRASMTPSELQAFLHQRARQQARLEKEEKLNELRAKGIFVQTEEEREKDQLELENLLEKARKEAQELAKREKDAAKKDGTVQGGDQLMASEDEGEDGEWEGSKEEEEGEVELSGSEDEEAETDDQDAASDASDDLLDNMAVESDAEDEEPPNERTRIDGENIDDQESDGEPKPAFNVLRARPRRSNVVEDDEDEREIPTFGEHTASTAAPDNRMAAFGFDSASAAPFGLSQAFAGTMADLDSQTQVDGTQRGSQTSFRQFPVATLPEPDDTPMVDVPSTPSVQHRETHVLCAMHEVGVDQTPLKLSPQVILPHTQFSEMPTPTQDAGLQYRSLELSRTEVPQSTEDTLILPIVESPIAKKKGRLQRRKEVLSAMSDVYETDAADPNAINDDGDFIISANAFDVMRKAARKPGQAEVFDKRRSEAKNMVQEQAEESEDEYAGLGGASDDESTGEVDEEIAKMIDEGEVEVDERKIAALYADKERADDEKRIDKLYKDITNGALRRKRGADFDLSDSDDDGEERRRRKQREFARMRKALLEDENIGKIATNPKRMAFLRAIEDHDSDSELDFLSAPASLSQAGQDSQDCIEAPLQSALIANTDANAPESIRGPLTTLTANALNKPLPSTRRTTADSSKKPTTLAEMRESISFLVEEPHSVPDTQPNFSDSDTEPDDDDDADNDDNADADTASPVTDSPISTTPPAARAPFIARRTTARPAVIDRLSLSREASLNSASASDTQLAFHAPSPSTSFNGSFKVPSLLRRATTNLSAALATSQERRASAGGSPAAVSQDGGVRRGGSRKSSIHYQAREAERRARVEKAERRRSEGVRKMVVQGARGMLGGWAGTAEGFE